MGVQRGSLHHCLAGAAMPAGVSAAAMPKAGDVADEDLAGAERVSVGAAARRVGHPLAAPAH